MCCDDFGADRIFVYQFDAHRTCVPPGPLQGTPGSGPRHLIFSPDGRFLYLLTELSRGCAFIAGMRARLPGAVRGTVGLFRPMVRIRDSKKSAGEIALSAMAGLYTCLSRRPGQRGVYQGKGKANCARYNVPALAKSPWSMAIDPAGRWLFVANEAPIR